MKGKNQLFITPDWNFCPVKDSLELDVAIMKGRGSTRRSAFLQAMMNSKERIGQFSRSALCNLEMNEELVLVESTFSDDNKAKTCNIVKKTTGLSSFSKSFEKENQMTYVFSDRV